MSDTQSRDRDEERPRPKVDGATKLAQLQEKLTNKKQRFYTLSEQVFDINQECMSKNDEMKGLKDQCARNNEVYVDAMTELALKEADLQYRKEHSNEKSSNVTNFELESNQDVERYRSELKYALQKYQESRRNAKKLQAEFSRLSDSSRVESLNFLAFCKYSQSVQVNEINKLSVSNELPSKKEISVCTTEFSKCAERSRSELSNFYKLKIHEFQREERIQLGKTKSIMEANIRNRDGTMGNNVDMSENIVASIDHHLHVNSLENRTAQKLIADAQAQFYADAHPPVPKTGSFSRGPSRHGSFSGSFSGLDSDDRASKAGKLAAALSAAVATEHSAQSLVASNNNHNRNNGGASRGNKRAGSAAGGGARKAAEPTPSGMVSKPTTAPKQKSQFRTQLSQQYRQRKRAANTSNNATIQYSLGPAPKLKSVFDATPFRTLATPESNLLQNTLLDTELTDTVTSTNLVLSESGKYIDQGEALGNLMSQLCAAEGKFRQLNAIKEGLDMQLVKQAHFLLLIGRDLHSDIVSKAHVGSNPIIPTIISNSGGSSNVNKVLETELTQAFARPDESTSRSVGSLTAGGAIGNKYRYRIDPSATTAAPLVPFTEVQQDYKECEDKIRKFLYDTARVLKIK